MIEISLPEELAQRAGDAGLLSKDAVRQLFEDALRRRAGRALMNVALDIRNAAIPPLSMEEIEAELDQMRAERRAGRTALGGHGNDAGGS